jgi:hypothetical protein
MTDRCGGGSDPAPSGLTRRLTPRWSLPPRHFRNTERICRGYFTDGHLICAGYQTDSFVIVC